MLRKLRSSGKLEKPLVRKEAAWSEGSGLVWTVETEAQRSTVDPEEQFRRAGLGRRQGTSCTNVKTRVQIPEPTCMPDLVAAPGILELGGGTKKPKKQQENKGQGREQLRRSLVVTSAACTPPHIQVHMNTQPYTG